MPRRRSSVFTHNPKPVNLATFTNYHLTFYFNIDKYLIAY
uniref:Uncharacterized protein n=1 Tax=Siphoviridae sp. ct7es18 TaxID=2826166 RepID=A0A8S5MH38_9CAUD|nr:MAG TPA: hypothetical protein [Siphoviridae sp. ct7es18]